MAVRSVRVRAALKLKPLLFQDCRRVESLIVPALMAKLESSLALHSGLQHSQSWPFHLGLAHQTEALIHVL